VKEVDYQLIVGNLYKLGAYGILRHCVLEHERSIILEEAHDGIVGGHYAGKINGIEYFMCRDLVAYTAQRCEGLDEGVGPMENYCAG
jgi:hypothetical protein